MPKLSQDAKGTIGITLLFPNLAIILDVLGSLFYVH